MIDNSLELSETYFYTSQFFKGFGRAFAEQEHYLSIKIISYYLALFLKLDQEICFKIPLILFQTYPRNLFWQDDNTNGQTK